MKKIEVLKFFIVVLTIWALDALASYSILLLNLKSYEGFDGYQYPSMYYSIPYWLGISLFFLFIPILLWVWYYFELSKIRKYYQNLAVSGTEIIATVNNEIENLISRGILTKESANAKKNHLILEYENEKNVKRAILEEQEKLNSLNSLNRLKAIDDIKYQTEKKKIKDEIIILKRNTGFGSKVIEINNFVADSCLDFRIIYFTIFVAFFGIIIINSKDTHKDANALIIILQIIIFIIWFSLKSSIDKFDKNQRNFWNKTDEEE